MLTNNDKVFYQRIAKESGKNKYLFCDMHRQQVHYYLRLDSLANAKEHFEKLECLLKEIAVNDRPEWYTIEHLEKDRQAILQLEKRKG